jgi:hypothetical protein
MPIRSPFVRSLIAGFAGAAAVTIVHETARRLSRSAPRMDVLGRETIGRTYEAAGAKRPYPQRLQQMALAGDLVSNSLYYSLAGFDAWGLHALTRGGMLGLFAGVGAVALPPIIGLPAWPTQRTPATQAMALSWYTLGGLVAGGVMMYFEQQDQQQLQRGAARRRTGTSQRRERIDWGPPAARTVPTRPGLEPASTDI